MSFDSLDYLLFLSLVTLLHWLCPQKVRWAVLLFASPDVKAYFQENAS